MFLSGNRGVFRSTGGGATWISLYPRPVNGLALDSAAATIYIGPLSRGLLRSLDRGVTWQPTNLTFPVVRSITADPIRSRRLWVASLNNFSDVFVMKIVE